MKETAELFGCLEAVPTAATRNQSSEAVCAACVPNASPERADHPFLESRRVRA